MEIDPKTGLPALPDDMVWTIKVEYGYIKIELFQKIKVPWGFGLKKTQREFIDLEVISIDHEDAEAQIPIRAAEILKEWNDGAETRRRREEERAQRELERQERIERSRVLGERLNGDYPPKRLG